MQETTITFPSGDVTLALEHAVEAGLGQPAAPPEAFANPRAAVHIDLSLAAVTLLIGSGVFGAGDVRTGAATVETTARRPRVRTTMK